MKFIDGAINGKNDAVRYILGVTLIVFAYIIGSTFLFIDICVNFHSESIPETESEIIQLIGKNRFLALVMIPFIFVFIALFFITTKVHGLKFVQLITGRTSIDFKRIAFSFGVIVLIQTLLLGIQVYFNPNIVWQFDFQKFLPLFLIALLLIPIQTTCEEMLFRGYIMQGFKLRTKNNLIAILVSGIMFGMVHIGNPEIEVIGYHIIVYYIAVGIFLGLISYFDNGMELAIGYHAANNLFAALLITTNWQVFQTDAVFIDNTPPQIGWETIIGILVILPLLFFLFKRKYNWGNLELKDKN
jgi:membrane protease YdiL (CAAX protease family)